MKKIFSRIVNMMEKHYSETFKKYGETSRGVDWGRTENAKLRLKKMAEVILKTPDELITILDIGCGYGAFFEYLKNNFKWKFKYIGIDICTNMIKKAKSKYPKADFIVGDFMSYDFGNKKFDYLICNGIFTQKLTASTMEMNDYIKLFIKKMNHLSKKGFVFNIMSTYVNFQTENLYYFSPPEMLSYLLFNISKNIKMDHSYKLYEYSCYVYK